MGLFDRKNRQAFNSKPLGYHLNNTAQRLSKPKTAKGKVIASRGKFRLVETDKGYYVINKKRNAVSSLLASESEGTENLINASSSQKKGRIMDLGY